MDDKGERENKKERGRCWSVPLNGFGLKPLQLHPPLAVFFLIASWAISGSLFKWEVGGSECSEGVGRECVCVCVCVCGGGIWPCQGSE